MANLPPPRLMTSFENGPLCMKYNIIFNKDATLFFLRGMTIFLANPHEWNLTICCKKIAIFGHFFDLILFSDNKIGWCVTSYSICGGFHKNYLVMSSTEWSVKLSWNLISFEHLQSALFRTKYLAENYKKKFDII